MIGYKSYVHMGWHAYKYNNATIDDCPFADRLSISKEWRDGWYKANKGEPWQEPRRKSKVVE